MAIIGREPLADVVLPFPGVSSRHAYLEPLGAGRYRVADLGSSNGTYVGGRRVQTSDVSHGEDLRFGSVAFDWHAHRATLEGELALPRGLTLGRDPSCDVVVADGRVSSRHLRIVPQGVGHLLIDTGSANGLFVNGRPVSKAVVGPSDEVRLGTLRIDVPGLVQRRSASPPAMAAVMAPPSSAPVVSSVPEPVAAPQSLRPQTSGGRAWAWATAAILVLGLGGAGAAFATRQDVVSRCELGLEDAYREDGVFFWDVKEARSRAQAHRWCAKHAEEPVLYKKTTKCATCGKVLGVESVPAPRRDEPRDIEVREGYCSDACRFERGLRDAGAAATDLVGKALDTFLR